MEVEEVVELAELLIPPLEIDTELEEELELELVEEDPYKVGLYGPIGEAEDTKLTLELAGTELDERAEEGI